MTGFRAAALVTIASASGSAQAESALAGFEQLARAGETIEFRKPAFQSGELRVGEARGRVERGPSAGAAGPPSLASIIGK